MKCNSKTGKVKQRIIKTKNAIRPVYWLPCSDIVPMRRKKLIRLRTYPLSDPKSDTVTN